MTDSTKPVPTAMAADDIASALADQDLPPAMLAAAQKYPGLGRAIATGVESHDGREIALLKYIYALPDLETKTRGHPQALLDAMDAFAAEHDFLINIAADKARILRALLVDEWSAAPPATTRGRPLPVYVEVGGYLGYSAIVAGLALRELADRRPCGSVAELNVQVWSIELDPLFASIAMNFVDLVGLRDLVRVVTGTAGSLGVVPGRAKVTETAPAGAGAGAGGLDLVREWAGRVDFLLLDHDEALYAEEFERFRAAGLLKQGSVVIADNVVRPGAPEYRKLVRGLDGVTSEGVKGLIQPGDLEDELEVTRLLRDL